MDFEGVVLLFDDVFMCIDCSFMMFLLRSAGALIEWRWSFDCVFMAFQLCVDGLCTVFDGVSIVVMVCSSYFDGVFSS